MSSVFGELTCREFWAGRNPLQYNLRTVTICFSMCMHVACSGADRTPRSSDCLVITIMELPANSPSSDELRTLNAAEAVALYRRHSSQDSLACDLPTRKCGSWTSRRLPRCLLGALCMVSPLVYHHHMDISVQPIRFFWRLMTIRYLAEKTV